MRPLMQCLTTIKASFKLKHNVTTPFIIYPTLYQVFDVYMTFLDDTTSSALMNYVQLHP